jgi:citrate transporter
MLIDNWRLRGSKQADNVHNTFAEVEWTTIFFFLGLFVVVHAVEVSGVLGLLAGKIVGLTGGRIATAGTVILWSSAFLSAIFDNIPFVATMIPLIKSMAPAFGGPAAFVVVSRAWRLPWRQRHPHWRRVKPRRRRHRRAQRDPLRFYAIPRLRRADDSGVDCSLPTLRLAPILLIALTFPPRLPGGKPPFIFCLP